MIPIRTHLLIAALALTGLARAADEHAAVEKLLDGIVRQENQLIEDLRSSSAIIETYIQEIPDSAKTAESVVSDHYFLGRLDFANGLSYTPISDRAGQPGGWKRLLGKNRPMAFFAGGFAQMALPDADS